MQRAPRSCGTTCRRLPARSGWNSQILNPGTSREIDAAFAALVRERADALFVGPDGFYNTRRVQRHVMPTAFSVRDMNPAVDASIIGAAIADDPVAAAAEYGGDFRDDLQSFITPEALEAVTSRGVFERPRVEGELFRFRRPVRRFSGQLHGCGRLS
jgi:hypothetical protein